MGTPSKQHMHYVLHFSGAVTLSCQLTLIHLKQAVLRVYFNTLGSALMTSSMGRVLICGRVQQIG